MEQNETRIVASSVALSILSLGVPFLGVPAMTLAAVSAVLYDARVGAAAAILAAGCAFTGFVLNVLLLLAL